MEFKVNVGFQTSSWFLKGDLKSCRLVNQFGPLYRLQISYFTVKNQFRSLHRLQFPSFQSREQVYEPTLTLNSYTSLHRPQIPPPKVETNLQALHPLQIPSLTVKNQFRRSISTSRTSLQASSFIFQIRNQFTDLQNFEFHLSWPRTGLEACFDF